MIKMLDIAVKASIKAGEFLNQKYRLPIKVNLSNEKDIKLQSDLDSEKIIFDVLKKETDISILSEEFGYLESNDKNPYKWIVDPLDGSLNFSRSIFINCVSIGLWEGNKPILGVIYDFIHDNLYTGIVGKKAMINGALIKTSDIKKKKEAILLTGFPVYSSFSTSALNEFVSQIQGYKKVRLFGSAAISLALVGKGSAEAYKENNIAIWDVAAGIPIVLAAGGKCEISKGDKKNLLNVYAHNGVLE